MDFVCYKLVGKHSGIPWVELKDSVKSSAIQRTAFLQTEKIILASMSLTVELKNCSIRHVKTMDLT